MSRRVAEVAARRAEMFPADALMAHAWYRPTADEIFAWRRYGLSEDAQRMALYSARQCSAQAEICYRAIAGSCR